MGKSLGIQIKTERLGRHLKDIVPAAGRKQIALYVHISGSAVRLCLQDDFITALTLTHATICHQSAARFGVLDHVKAHCPWALTSDLHHPLDIHQCQKQIVL